METDRREGGGGDDVRGDGEDLSNVSIDMEFPKGTGFPSYNAETQLLLSALSRYSTVWFWRGVIVAGPLGYLIGRLW